MIPQKESHIAAEKGKKDGLGEYPVHLRLALNIQLLSSLLSLNILIATCDAMPRNAIWRLHACGIMTLRADCMA